MLLGRSILQVLMKIILLAEKFLNFYYESFDSDPVRLAQFYVCVSSRYDIFSSEATDRKIRLCSVTVLRSVTKKKRNYFTEEMQLSKSYVTRDSLSRGLYTRVTPLLCSPQMVVLSFWLLELSRYVRATAILFHILLKKRVLPVI
jgi:hypothetical protein